jgi:hypothetical protein
MSLTGLATISSWSDSEKAAEATYPDDRVEACPNYVEASLALG